MEETSPRPAMLAPAAALVLAAGAVILFGVGNAVGFLSDGAESLYLITSLVGWLLLVWALIITGGVVVGSARRALARRRVSRLELALLGACVALLVLAVWLRPLWGSGAGTGG